MKVLYDFFLKIFFVSFIGIHELYPRFVYPKKITEFIQQYPETKLTQCTKNYKFDYPEFPLYPEYKSNYFPNKGLYSDIFILEIPKGVVSIDAAHCSSKSGYTFVNDIFIKETGFRDLNPFKEVSCIERPDINIENVFFISGRVAVIDHMYSWIYGPFILDLLSRIALLEIFNIEYDYLLIPYNQQYAKEALEI